MLGSSPEEMCKYDVSKFIEEARTHAPTLLSIVENLARLPATDCHVLQVQASTDEFAPKGFVSFHIGHYTKNVCHI